MSIRQFGCADCARLTSGDCGQHGPRILEPKALSGTWRLSDKYLAEQATLTTLEQPVFEQLCDEYRLAQWNRGRHPFVSYTALADLVRWGWRRTTPP